MEWYAIVGRNIRRHRSDRDWTIEELAYRAKMDEGYLGKVELGKRNPSLKKLINIAIALHVGLDELFLQ